MILVHIVTVTESYCPKVFSVIVVFCVEVFSSMSFSADPVCKKKNQQLSNINNQLSPAYTCTLILDICQYDVSELLILTGGRQKQIVIGTFSGVS